VGCCDRRDGSANCTGNHQPIPCVSRPTVYRRGLCRHRRDVPVRAATPPRVPRPRANRPRNRAALAPHHRGKYPDFDPRPCVGLYFVSPPDTIDASLLRAPTWFSLFGVVALWGAVLTALLAMTRLKLPMRPRSWKRLHQSIASIVVIATALHAIQIEGAMEVMSKTLLAGTIVAATVFAARRYRSP
jgi:hypothetical protein